MELFNTHSEACIISSSIKHSELSHGKMWLNINSYSHVADGTIPKNAKKWKVKVSCV